MKFFYHQLLIHIVVLYHQNYSSETIPVYQNGRQYKHQSISTGDDYPLWWLQLTTDLILSDSITNQTEEKEKSLPPPSPRQDQSVQTDS